MYFKYIVVVFFIWTTMAFSQSAIVKGTLYDDKNVVLTSVEIGLLASNGTFDQKVYSDNEGKYEFTNVPYGTYTLLYSKGNVSDFISIEVNRAVITHDLFLDTNFFTSDDKEAILSEVVIKVESVKSKLEKEGFTVNVVETKDAVVRNIQVNELLDRSAGVRIRQDGGLGSHIHYNINGMSGNAVKIFIDGIPSTNYGRSFSLNSIPSALIDRIEVYKGVVPGYLSDDALGGAINIVMKRSKKNFLTTSYSYGSFNTHQYNANGSFQTERGFIVDASVFYNYSDNNYEVWGDDIIYKDYQGRVTKNHKAKRFHDAYRSYGTKVDFGWVNKEWTDRFIVSGVFSDDFKEMQNGITMQKVFGDRHSKRSSKVIAINYAKKDLFTEGFSTNIDVSYSNLKSQVIDTVGIMYDWRGKILYPDGTPVRYKRGAELGQRETAEINTDKTWVIRANIGYEINDNNKFYLNYLHNNFDRGFSDDCLPWALQKLENTRDLQKNIATISYENLSFNDRLRTSVFYKHYHQKVTSKAPYQIPGTTVSYGVNIISKNNEYDGYGATFSYELFSKLNIIGSAEKAIRFPNEREIFGNQSENLNPGNVEPEKSTNVNIGFIFGTYSLGKHSIRINTSLFYRDTKGMISQALTAGNSGTSYYENLENVMTKGIDAEIFYNYFDKINFTFNISKFDVLFNTKYDKYGNKYLFYRKQIRNEPSFKFNANLSYYLNNFFQRKSQTSIHYNIAYVNKFLRNWSNVGLYNLDTIPHQLSNNIGITYTFPTKKVTLSFDAKNIFNEQIFDNFGLQKPGRSFFGKITYNIL